MNAGIWSVNAIASMRKAINRGHVINVEMSLLDALAMVALRIRQTEQALLQKVTMRCQLILYPA